MKDNLIKVLITAIGTVNGGTIISELKKYDKKIYIVGADINDERNIVSSKFVDEYHKFPSAIDDQKKYLDFVYNFCRENKIDFVYAFIDEEVYNLSKNRELFESINTKLCLTDNNSVRLCHFKNLFFEWLNNNFNKYCIKTYNSYEETEFVTFPLFIKPVEGRASIGCKKIEQRSELLELKFSDYIVQDFVEGDIFVIDIVRNKKTKEMKYCQRKELLRNGNGCGTSVEIVDIPELKKMAIELSEAIDFNGILSIELFRTKNNEYKIIEINPRLPAGTSYSCLAGCNTVVNMLHIQQDLPFVNENVRVGAKFARRYETYEM